MTELRLFTYKNSLVSYIRFGHGKDVLVAFHGYNQSAHDFLYFQPVWDAAYTVIAIDFFWHGKSEWREKEDFTEHDMKEIVLGIAKQERLVARKFSICSFSMGSRMARALVRTFPERIQSLILISPPTFTFHYFLNFTMNTMLGLGVFRYFLTHNQVLLKCTVWLYKLHILNRAVYIFTSKFISKPERLEKVYKTWYAQRKLRTRFGKFAQLLNQHNIHLVLIAGKNDHITPPHQTVRFVRKLKSRQIFLMPKKHELQTPETLHVFRKLISGHENTGLTIGASDR